MAPVFIIMVGPPGSGKSSSLSVYLNRYIPNLDHSTFKQLNVDDYVYKNKGYKKAIAELSYTDKEEDRIKQLRTLFKEYNGQAQKEFYAEVKDRLEKGLNTAMDIGGRGIYMFKEFMSEIKKNDYEVHIVYTYVKKVNELMDRIFARYKERGQTPVPKHIVEDAIDKSPESTRSLFKMFQDRLVRIVVMDTSEGSFNKVIMSYDRPNRTCSYYEFKFEPCIYVPPTQNGGKKRGSSRASKA